MKITESNNDTERKNKSNNRKNLAEILNEDEDMGSTNDQNVSKKSKFKSSINTSSKRKTNNPNGYNFRRKPKPKKDMYADYIENQLDAKDDIDFKVNSNSEQDYDSNDSEDEESVVSSDNLNELTK